MNEGLLSALGEGFRGIGAVASPDVAARQAQERAEALPNLLRTIQVTNAQREQQANAEFQKAVQGKVQPGMTSSAMLDAIKDVDPYILSTAPAARTYLEFVGQRQTKEAVIERERQRLQATLDTLNKPTEHVVGGKLIRSYRDGRTETVDLGLPNTSNTRFSISPKDYTPESLKKYSETNNVGDLVAVDRKATDEEGTQMSPESLDNNAFLLLATGKYPTNLGRGVQGARQRTQIDNRMAELAKDRGIRLEELPAIRAQYAAQSKALLPLQNYLNRVDQFLDAFNKNVGVLNGVMEKGVAGGGAPILNAPVNALRQQLGSEDYARFQAALNTVSREYGRIMTGPASNAQLTVHAQQMANELLNPNMTVGQLKAVLGIMGKDTTNMLSASATIMKDKSSALESVVPDRRKKADTQAPSKAQAPAAALDYLKAHPETKAAFKAKYGYLPDGY